MPEPRDRHARRDRDGRGMQQLGDAVADERRAHEHVAVGVDDRDDPPARIVACERRARDRRYDLIET